MPQLDFTTYVPQLFWLAATFFALFLLMTFFALPRVGAAIEGRRQRLDDDLARAAAMKAEAEAVLATYQKALASARAAAQAQTKATAERLAAEAAERHRQLAAELAGRIDAAEQQIVAAKKAALADIRAVAVDVAGSVAAKLTGAPLDPRYVADAVERTLAEH